MSKKISLVIFADGDVGNALVNWLIVNYYNDIALIVTTNENDIFRNCCNNGIKSYVFTNTIEYIDLINKNNIEIDLGLLIWWPNIIKEEVITNSNHGFVNTHPSLLPYNRGKHYNFWSLVEESPFGVSLHVVEQGIDNGSVVSQSKIEYDWEDTGESLYIKAKKEMVKLFQLTYPTLRNLEFSGSPQNLSKGSYHHSSEIDEASRLNLDSDIQTRKLLNLLRARTFEGKPGCNFKDKGIEYEIRINIKKK